jgi:hypothetical protein
MRRIDMLLLARALSPYRPGGNARYQQLHTPSTNGWLDYRESLHTFCCWDELHDLILVGDVDQDYSILNTGVSYANSYLLESLLL